MTNKQALEWIKLLIQTMHEETKGNFPDAEYKDEVYQALNIARQSLIDKDCDTCKHNAKDWDEEPCDGCHGYSAYEAKPKYWIHRNDDYTDWLECPNCGYGDEGEVEYGKGTPYCPYCGERLYEEIN